MREHESRQADAVPAARDRRALAVRSAPAQEPAPAPETPPAAQPADAPTATAAADVARRCGRGADGCRADKVEYSKKGADTCLTCHDDAHVMAIFQTPSRPAARCAQPLRQGPAAVRGLPRSGRQPHEEDEEGRDPPADDPIRPRFRRAGFRAERRVPCLPREIHERQLARRSARCEQRLLRGMPRPARDEGPGPGAPHAAGGVLHLPRGQAQPVSEALRPPAQAGQDRLQRLPPAARHARPRRSS